ncbi:MAG: N-formylglutamate deformylase [Woeseiaceae bacterium]|nr:N-formylglutamate deformylase [Woeseiaceae bacterium]
MSDVFRFHAGDTPLVVSIPHDGWRIPADILNHMTGVARGIPDTDWHVAELYGFVRELGATVIAPDYSRYVVDLNRPPDDGDLYPGRAATGLCPTSTFAGEPIYLDDHVPDVAARLRTYWAPYHDKLREVLDGLVERHGYALLWDAHSIASRVPRLFDGELPVLNLGTFGGRSCAPALARAVLAEAEASDYSTVLDGRFRGGYITRHYGNPAANVHAIQLELAQRAYMDEQTLEFDTVRAGRLRETLVNMLQAFVTAPRA